MYKKHNHRYSWVKYTTHFVYFILFFNFFSLFLYLLDIEHFFLHSQSLSCPSFYFFLAALGFANCITDISQIILCHPSMMWGLRAECWRFSPPSALCHRFYFCATYVLSPIIYCESFVAFNSQSYFFYISLIDPCVHFLHTVHHLDFVFSH